MFYAINKALRGLIDWRMVSLIEIPASLIVIATGNNDQLILFNGVYQAMNIIDSSGPKP
jgi:hypothetical protein